MGWDEDDMLVEADLGGGGTVYYRYNSSGNRVRKVIVNGSTKKERLYVAEWELWQQSTNGTIEIERETLLMSDKEKSFLRLETLTIDNSNIISTPFTKWRYQCDNPLQSICLELDKSASIISYEEYYPFGTTSYRSGKNQAEVKLKQYRYNGKERDKETGLYYYGARFYAAWIGRFISSDPIGDDFPGLSNSQYASNNPILNIDLDGLEGMTGFFFGNQATAQQQAYETQQKYGDIPKKKSEEVDSENASISPNEVARISAHVYGGVPDEILINGWKPSSRDVGLKESDFNNSETGLQSGLYERKKNDGTLEYVYATAGTNPLELNDYGANIKQTTADSKQYVKSISNAKIISKSLGDAKLTFTGHSLGGGTASANALATGREAITFNAAGLSFATKIELGGLDSIFDLNYENITAYQMSNDPLTIIQDIFPIGAAEGKSILVRPGINGKGGHSIMSMIDALENPRPK